MLPCQTVFLLFSSFFTHCCFTGAKFGQRCYNAVSPRLITIYVTIYELLQPVWHAPDGGDDARGRVGRRLRLVLIRCMVCRPVAGVFIKGNLLRCKRLPFRLQKASFYNAKGYLLQERVRMLCKWLADSALCGCLRRWRRMPVYGGCQGVKTKRAWTLRQWRVPS